MQSDKRIRMLGYFLPILLGGYGLIGVIGGSLWFSEGPGGGGYRHYSMAGVSARMVGAALLIFAGLIHLALLNRHIVRNPRWNKRLETFFFVLALMLCVAANFF